MTENMCALYKLVTGTDAAQDRDAFHCDGQYTWVLDRTAIEEAVKKPIRAKKDALSDASVSRRLEAAAQLADMVHSDDHLAAAASTHFLASSQPCRHG